MGRYVSPHQTPAGTDLSIMNITGSAAIRPKWYDFIIGSDATPADVATEFGIARTTDTGAGGTALAENAIDPLTVAATAAAVGGTFTTQPADAGGDIVTIALNQRATFRWVAAPGGELITTATAGNGLHLRSVASGGTPNVNLTIWWEE